MNRETSSVVTSAQSVAASSQRQFPQRERRFTEDR